jgi:hypothetical protein
MQSVPGRALLREGWCGAESVTETRAEGDPALLNEQRALLGMGVLFTRFN